MSEPPLFIKFGNGNSVRVWPSGEIIFTNAARCTRTQITARGDVSETMDYVAVTKSKSVPGTNLPNGHSRCKS